MFLKRVHLKSNYYPLILCRALKVSFLLGMIQAQLNFLFQVKSKSSGWFEGLTWGRRRCWCWRTTGCRSRCSRGSSSGPDEEPQERHAMAQQSKASSVWVSGRAKCFCERRGRVLWGESRRPHGELKLKKRQNTHDVLRRRGDSSPVGEVVGLRVVFGEQFTEDGKRSP